MEKKKLIFAGTIIIVAVASMSFFAGAKYGSFKKGIGTGQGVDGKRMTGQGLDGMGVGGGRLQQGRNGDGQQRTGGARQNEAGGFVSGQITSKDDKSFTVKTMDGNSRIIFYSDQTAITKSDQANAMDMEVGSEVAVDGKVGPDGSVSAQNVQIKAVQ